MRNLARVAPSSKNTYEVKAGWFIPFMDKRVGGR